MDRISDRAKNKPPCGSRTTHTNRDCSMNLPNQLTLARCVMALLFVGVMSFENVFCYILAYVLFVAAALTDYYDGKIARERNLITNFGKLLDPVADKVLMVAAFIMMVIIPDLRIPGWTIVVILAREFLITGARSLAAAEGAVIAANKWGKAKTVLQMVYVLVFLLAAVLLEAAEMYVQGGGNIPGGLDRWKAVVGNASMVTIIFVAMYTVYSGVQFVRANWKILKLDNLS